MAENLPEIPLGDSFSETALLIGPPSGEHTNGICSSHLIDHIDTETALVLVSLTQSPGERVQAITEHGNPMPSNVTVIHARDGQSSQTDIAGIELRSIANPNDLSRLGIVISDVITEYAAEYPTSLCFHSITALLQFVELPRVFRFIHTLRGRVEKSGVRAHVHLDPHVHPSEEISTLRSLFDTVVRVPDEESSEHDVFGVGAPEEDHGNDHRPWETLFDGDS